MTSYNNFDFTNESSSDSVSNPDTFVDPANAFDDSDATTSTLSFTSTGDDDKTIGTTFSSKSLDVAYIKASTDLGSTGDYVNKIILQKYNGTSWIDFMILSETITQTNSFVGLVSNIGSCQGLRVKFETESSSGNTISIVVNDITYAQSYTYTPKLLLEELGGTNLEDLGDKTAIAEDHTATWKALLSSSIGSAQNAYQTLQANNVFENKDFLMADEFTDANGSNNTVNTGSTDAIYDSINNYCVLDFVDEASGDTTYNTSSFTNPENAFDSDDDTYADKTASSTNVANFYLGKTFTEKTIKACRIKASGFVNGDSGTEYVRIYLETYDGTDWSTYKTLISSSFSNGGTASYDDKVIIDESIQGLRVKVQCQTQYSTAGKSAKIYAIEYGTYDSSSSVIIDANTLTLDGTETAIAVYADATNTANTNIGVKAGDGSTQTSETAMSNNGVVVSIDNLSSGTLEIELILNTTDTTETPELYGYGVFLIR